MRNRTELIFQVVMEKVMRHLGFRRRGLENLRGDEKPEKNAHEIRT
jgi:hypothetical protein